MLSVTNDCLTSWFRCAEMLQVWCNEVLKTSSRCAELLVGTNSALVTAHIKSLNQSLCDLAGREIHNFKTMISTELSQIMKDEKNSDNEHGKCSDAKVITQCVCAFVETQLRFFQSAAGQLSQFSSYRDGDFQTPCEMLTSSSHASQQVAAVGDKCSTQTILAPSNDFSYMGSAACLSRPPGLPVSPQPASPQPATEKSQRNAGRCATDTDLNLVIQMLSQSSSGITKLTNSTEPTSSLFNWAPSSSYSLIDHQVAGSNVWSTSNPHSVVTNPSLLDQVAAVLRDTGVVSAEALKTGSWPLNDDRPTGHPPPTVFVEEPWPSLGTEIWSQYIGWSPGKLCDSATANNSTTVVDSCSSDESPNGETAQIRSVSSNSQIRRRHSSSEQGSLPLNSQLTPLNVAYNSSESKSTWGLTVPHQQYKTGVTIDGHRPLFMQRSDPLAQRPFSCWQTGGGIGQLIDSNHLLDAAGSNGALSQHRTTSDRTF